ncbi:MFS transporter [Streptomyces solicathayae]|uniref:MFS transporter n=1 Tax=Streptomyces solicathayae TaxID=3081768 RepID=A0ABZ0LPS6_9ACTN|nr:MFS transporter [Streptomyces sp. HUAS YS2]WOX21451.1 MFS transporter [Streptomyces sp. HUAS YS2]
MGSSPVPPASTTGAADGDGPGGRGGRGGHAPWRELRRHRPFLLLCGEQAASSVGRQITALALALLAVTRLHAGPFGASALLALTYLPGAVLSPFAGVLADRARLRALAVTLTSLQVVVVGSVPVAGAMDRLGLPQLYVVAALSGALTWTLAVALQAALPRVVPPERLLAGNSALTGARTAGQIGGPALGGVLVGFAGAAPALLAAAAAYAVEAALLFALPASLNRPAVPAAARGPRFAALCEGFAVVRAEPVLRRQVLAGAGFNLGSGAADALFVLYAGRELALAPWQLGTVYATFSVATVGGVALAGRFATSIGLYRATRICALVAALSIFLVPAASLGLAFPALLAYQLVFGGMATVWAISMTTTQQLIAPPRLQGRVAGFAQAALLATVPVGALSGGALAAWAGSAPVLTGAAATALLAAASFWLPHRTATGPRPDEPPTG